MTSRPRGAQGVSIRNPQSAIRNCSAFTMIEVAICLAIIGFALVAIIGVLPIGMNTQREVREETIINQDATVLLEAIRSAARGADDLTNFVYAVTNYRVFYDTTGVQTTFTFGWTTSDYLTNGANIIGLLSTPEYTENQQPAYQPPMTPPSNFAGYSNHIVAYVRSISGLAAEKPPQDNQIMRDDTLTYRVYVANAAVPVDTNRSLSGFSKQIAGNQRELRMTFLWPQQPNGKLGNGRQTFRATIAGQILLQKIIAGIDLYYYQPQTFTNTP
jgi:type II secretory pathway pseudopilin PulG